MRLLQVGDLHIGKRLNEVSLLEDQQYILQQILDIAAAKILWERGIDTGLKSVGGKVHPVEEIFLSGNHLGLYDAWSYDITVDEKAEVLSFDGDLPLSYRYENTDGQRFLVLNFATDILDKRAYIWKQYARGRQIAENVQWLSGQKLPACAPGHPNLYMQCKEDAGSLTVGLWNFHPDPVFAPVVQLGAEYGKLECLNTEGILSGDQVELAEIPPYGFVAFTLSK